MLRHHALPYVHGLRVHVCTYKCELVSTSIRGYVIRSPEAACRGIGENQLPDLVVNLISRIIFGSVWPVRVSVENTRRRSPMNFSVNRRSCPVMPALRKWHSKVSRVHPRNEVRAETSTLTELTNRIRRAIDDPRILRNRILFSNDILPQGTKTILQVVDETSR